MTALDRLFRIVTYGLVFLAGGHLARALQADSPREFVWHLAVTTAQLAMAAINATLDRQTLTDAIITAHFDGWMRGREKNPTSKEN